MEAAAASHEHLFTDIALCIVVAWGLAVAARLFKQPLILAYLAAGVLLGPIGLKWVQDQQSISTISELGLMFLLFMIGLEMDLKQILSAGRAIIITALVQLFGGLAMGLLIFKLCGFALGSGRLDALYLAVAAALSSTVIVVKLLYDKRELNTLVGRITLGVLVFQDLFAILFLALQPNLNDPALGQVLFSLFKVAVMLAAALVASRYALPTLFRAVALMPELVLVGALAWCFLVCGLAQQLELSREMGALIAGVALSTFPYALDVTARVTTLRDFFLTLFFVALGMTIPSPDWKLAGWSLLFTLFLLASRMATVFLPLHFLRLGHRVSLLSAVNLSQVSEFSLVILTLGITAHHLDAFTQGIVAYSFVLLAIHSSYVIMKNDGFLRRVAPLLQRLGFPDREQAPADAGQGHVHAGKPIYFLGFCWTASSLLEEISRQQPELLKEIGVIDFNPQVNDELRRRGISITYGDISQRDTLMHAGVGQAEVIFCTIPNSLLKGTSNLRLVQELRDIAPKAKIIAHAERLTDIPVLYAAGVDYVTVPRLIEAQNLFDLLHAARDGRLAEKREEEERQLSGRKEVIP